MKKEFIKYLESIGIAGKLCERIEEISEFYIKTAKVEIIDIFVTDYLLSDGTRSYEDLRFFSTKYWMEATNFLAKDHFDISLIKNRIVRWEIQKQDYDLISATEKSKLTLTVRFDTGMYSVFKASKENCNHLRDIIYKHVMPNLKE